MLCQADDKISCSHFSILVTSQSSEAEQLFQYLTILYNHSPYFMQPEMLLWRWYQKKMALARNDYFQFSTADCLAVGGAPAYALKLDGDLTFGRSGISETFGNAPLAAQEEFQIGRVEVWSLL